MLTVEHAPDSVNGELQLTPTSLEAHAVGRPPREHLSLRRLGGIWRSLLDWTALLSEPRCPRCRTQGAYLETCRAKDEQHLVHMANCPACGHEWPLLAFDPFLGF